MSNIIPSGFRDQWPSMTKKNKKSLDDTKVYATKKTKGGFQPFGKSFNNSTSKTNLLFPVCIQWMMLLNSLEARANLYRKHLQPISESTDIRSRAVRYDDIYRMDEIKSLSFHIMFYRLFRGVAKYIVYGNTFSSFEWLGSLYAAHHETERPARTKRGACS